MYRRTVLGLVASVTCTAMVSVFSAVTATAADTTTTADQNAAIIEATSPEMFAAMQRDLGFNRSEAIEQLAWEHGASTDANRMQETLGDRFAGAWLTDDRQLVVAVTDPSAAGSVHAAGAVARVVPYSERQLDSAVAAFDDIDAPSEVSGWAVDTVSNQVVIWTDPGSRAPAAAFIRDTGVDPAMVRVETAAQRPEPLFNIKGGDRYSMPGGVTCSVGFSVQPRGYVTAGHCGTVGTTTAGYNGVAQGVFERSSFPGADGGYVAANSSWDTQPWVNIYVMGIVATVKGAQEAAVGASVCRSGATTGWRCGNITAKNQTVLYPQGAVSGLTRTTACAEKGDSGGPFLAGNGQAQGVTSGGSGDCSSGGVTFFQRLNPMLGGYGLTLVTG